MRMDKNERSFYHYRVLSGRRDGTTPPVVISRPRHFDHRLHAHDFLEMVIVNGGSGIHLLETREYPIASGDVFVIPRGIRHGYRDVRNFRITNMLFKPGTVERHFPEIAAMPGFLHFFRADSGAPEPGGLLNLDSAGLAAVEKLQESILREQEKREPGCDSMCLACLAELLIFLCRLLEKHALPPLPPHRGFAEVRFYVSARFRERIRVEELAAVARMSVRNFQRRFSAENGTSPMQYVRQVRLEKARELLRRTGQSVTEIAAECGFPGASALSTEFRREFGVTPRAFRKSV